MDNYQIDNHLIITSCEDFSIEENVGNLLHLAENTNNFFRTQIRMARYSLKKRIEVAKSLTTFFGKELKDPKYFEWLAKTVGLKDSVGFKKLSCNKKTYSKKVYYVMQ